MSRSASIWLVYDKFAQVIGAFTVKHEMLSWVRRKQGHGYPVHSWSLYRVNDNPGPDDYAECMDLAQLLEDQLVE